MHPLFRLCLRCLLLLPFGLAAQDQLVLSPGSGYYTQPVKVGIRGGDAGVVYYTTDGSAPTPRSARYTGTPVALATSGVLRAALFSGLTQVGGGTGGSYLIAEPSTTLLTVSVGVDPWRLFNPVSGWFMPGPDPGTGAWDPQGANWWTHREHPVHVDLLEADGTPVHGGTLGLRMFGGVSRMHPQKSFSLSGRKEYGNKRINYPLFGPDSPQDFRFLVVRNGGSDWARSYIRDALLTGLLVDPSWDLDVQAARPVRVYLNGTYWGLYHLREKINPRFLADHHGVDKDSLSLLEHQATRKHGTTSEYRQLQEFITSQDLTKPANFRHLGKLMDIDNFQRLQIAQTYFDNRDAGGNIRYWRPDGPDQRFRWILYDVDQGFGLHRETGWETNTLAFNTDSAGPSWPNPPWSTYFQRRLLTNPDYRRTFVNRSLDYLHTDFSPEAVAERIEAAVAAVEGEMPRQLERWDGRMDHWQYHIEQLRKFSRLRPAFLREHLRNYSSGGADRRVELSAGLGGYLVLNDNINVGSDGLSGAYFANLPLTLEAVPEPGYHFAGWEGAAGGDVRLEVPLREDRVYRIRASFAPARHQLADQIIINEICPLSREGGDWLELYNRSTQSVALTGWYLVDDSGRRFSLPATYLAAGDYLVVCRRGNRFRETYPEVADFVEGLPFGLHRMDDRIGLYSADGSYVNAISYQLPERLDSAFSYALALPGLDNGKRRNWVVEAGRGTPGTANPTHLQTAVVSRQSYWTRVGIGLAVLLLVGVVRTLKAR